MDLGIADRKAIVCGSSKGLGRACAQHLAEAGCEVLVNGRDVAGTEAAASEIAKATGAKVMAVAADVTTREGQTALFSACAEPDILVLNAAGPPPRDVRDLTRQQMLDGVVSNMVSGIELVQRALDPMIRKKFGRIVAITSGSVKMPLAGLDLSSGARAGLTAFLSGVARNVAQHNVAINFLLPGAFDTQRLQSIFEVAAKRAGGTPDAARAARVAATPARRVGVPDEFGATCAFLCSAHAGYIIGQNVLIDGGAYPGAF